MLSLNNQPFETYVTLRKFGIGKSIWCHLFEFDTIEEILNFIEKKEVKGCAYVVDECHGAIFECCRDKNNLIERLQYFSQEWDLHPWRLNTSSI